ncbi:extracellular solute-binding protein [Enterobacter cloacae]|uniref:ABC-type sugar transport system, periplasmic component n=1 Tax=Enterobacter cloacae TaxID=550 RepID=A0A144FA97_ENTCL|nr:extracellular solute-binding protein [Enterobacter cloacae]CZU78054.1 ABC-type sugar transport system%2C periplasmic component [Enterobacter cloacae]SAF98783.1 ABC-type sugar transport system%2C periplasmic component [Enterobacter cloacae]
MNVFNTLTRVLLGGVLMCQVAQAEPVTIRVVEKDLLTTNREDVEHIHRIEQALARQGHDIKIEIVNLSSSGYSDVLNVMLLSGTIPDLIYFNGSDQKMVEQGILEDWRPWIAQTHYLKEALWPHNKLRLQNHPTLLYVYPLRARQPVIREDWLQKGGFNASPKTLEEYVTLFNAIHSGNFNGDGKADTAGITSEKDLRDLDGFLNPAFGIRATWLKDVQGQWIHAQISPQERDKLQYYHSLYEKGLLSSQYITTNWELKEDQFYTGKVGVVSVSSPGNVGVYQEKMRQVHPDATLTLLDPPKGPGGQGLAAVDVSMETRGFAMSTLSKHKKEVMILLDFLASPEGQMMEQMGFEGTHYVRKDDAITVTPKINAWYPRFIYAANWKPPVEWRSPAMLRYIDNSQRYFAADNAFIFPSTFAAALDSTSSIYNEWAYKFVSGRVSFDMWDQYVNAWKSAGGNAMTQYAQEKLK